MQEKHIQPIDIDTGVVVKGRVLVQHTAIGPVILSLGPSADESEDDFAKSFDATHAYILKAIADGTLCKDNGTSALASSQRRPLVRKPALTDNLCPSTQCHWRHRSGWWP